MNPNMPIKSRTRRNTRALPEQDTQTPSMAINHHQSYMKMEHEHHYRLMEHQQQQQQQQKLQEPDQPFVLDLSLKNKSNNSMSQSSCDVEASSRDNDDDDVNMKSLNHHPLQSLLSLNGINKPMYTSNDMTLFWNMLMHFSFNNYNNYFNQQFKDSAGLEGLKGRY
jgi:hypothetical protein